MRPERPARPTQDPFPSLSKPGPTDSLGARRLQGARRRSKVDELSGQGALIHLSPSMLVSEFHRAFGLADRADPSLGPRQLEDLRIALIREELDELIEAFVEENLIEVADALGDLAYVIFGTAISFGIDLDAVIAEVHRSNMTKLAPDGSVLQDAKGKVRKGPNFEPPNLAPIVGQTRTDWSPA